MLSTLPSSPAHINGATSSLSSAPAPPFQPWLWRPLQSLQFTLAELSHGSAGNSKLSRDPRCAGQPLVLWNPSKKASTCIFCCEETQSSATLAKPNEEFFTVTKIENAASRQGLTLHMEMVGPFFRVRVLDLQSKEVLGVAQGAVKVWTCGRILHLDSVRLSPLSLKAKKPVFGIAFLLGAAAVRYGYDQNCIKAELLAIKDTDEYHSKLVRYYSRMGFRTVYDVMGESLKDIPHMLIWGGVGTRMDASIEELLLKWSPAFKKISK